jgi:mono/diheme cytochrome c family protein
MRSCLFLAFVLLTLVFSNGCVQTQHKTKEAKSDASDLASVLEKGKNVYKFQCLACHQLNGGGVPPLYPPLADNPRVNGDKEALIKIILNGQSGEITVHGKTYNGVMASYRNLSDEDIAAVLSYVRSNFGNDASSVSSEEVKALR